MEFLELLLIDTKNIIVYKDNEWKDKIYNAILEECRHYNVERGKDRILIKNLKMVIYFCQYNTTRRGIKVDNIFIQDGIPEECINTLFKPMMRVRDIIEIDYDENNGIVISNNDICITEYNKLKSEYDKLKRFYDCMTELYGKGLNVYGWHLNGEPESFDTFYEYACYEGEITNENT